MANLYNWRFFQDTGLSGGTANPTDYVYYVDSYNGTDIGGVTGAYNDPFKSIQKALDEMVNSSSVVVVAGYFKEGDFSGGDLNLVAEGTVTFDGVDNLDFMTINRSFFNYSGIYHIARYTYGKFIVKNYNKVGSSNHFWSYDTTFMSCIQIFSDHPNPYLDGFENNVLINSVLGTATLGFGVITCIVQHNTFINSNLIGFRYSLFMTMRSNYFDATSKFNITTAAPFAVFNNGVFDFNHFEGTLTNKIGGTGEYYTNTEALQIGQPTHAVNDIASTVDPLFNNPANEDYTLQEASPLVKSAHDKLQIGAFNVANIGETNSNSSKFDYVNISTGTTGEITLVSDGVGTATTKALYHHQIAPKKRLILKVLAPNLEQNFGLGETMGNLAADNTPPMTDIEIQYTTDTGTLVDGAVGSDDNYNGTWLRVPIGAQPFHDTSNNVGNDDPLFDVNNAVPIASKYVKMKITLRSNEAQI